MKILLVEDDQDSRIHLGKFLRTLGHQVVECANGYDALKAFQAGEFHMVLSDIKMPKMSGIELLQTLSSLPAGKDVDVVLFTGYGDMESAIKALRAGAYDYLLKPINVEELAAITECIVRQQTELKETANKPDKTDDAVQGPVETRQAIVQPKKAFARTMGLGEIVISSGSMRDVFLKAEKFHTDRSMPVLIQGETGTGKEVVARYVHYGNSAVTAPFVDINCAALTPSIFESELFGYEAGAFTGGLPKGQKGKLDIAAGGTVFLDEIAELSGDLQAKLLRVIQEKEFYRVGGLKKIKTDVRVICATNADIEKMVKHGAFRQDLYYRLSLGRLFLPPLRERAEEVLPMANMFLREFAQKRGKRFRKISDAAAGVLLSHSWPGNVRELRNAIEWVAFMYDDVELKPEYLDTLSRSSPESSIFPVVDPVNLSLPDGGLDLESYVNFIVRRALEMHNGNKTKTARYLGISRSSLYCRLERMEKKCL